MYMGKMLILETTESKKNQWRYRTCKEIQNKSWVFMYKKKQFCLVIAEFIPLITIKTRKHQNKCTVHPTALHV